MDEPPSHPDDAADDASVEPEADGMAHGRAARRASRKAATATVTTTDVAPRRRLPRRFPAVVFFALGFAALWVSILEAMATTSWDPGAAFTFVLTAVTPVVAVLIPGALLWNHPDAWSRARTLVFGTVIFASVSFFRAIEGGLQQTFKDLTPAPHPDVEWFIPSSLVYTSFVSLVGVFGLLYIGVGLSRTRNYAFTKRAIHAGYVILAVAALAVAGRLWTLTQVDLNDPTLTWDLWIYIGSIIAIGALTILVWAYVTRVITRCAISGEEPVAGWSVAAIGTCLILSAYLVVAWSTFVTITDDTLNSVVLYLRQIMTGVGSALLLAGFVLGMPSLERVVWDDDEEVPPDQAS